jgi:hypothetical protein
MSKSKAMSKARNIATGSGSGTTENRNTNPVIGDTYYNGTVAKLEIYTADGWVPLKGGIEYGDSDGRPADPDIGTPYFNGEVGRLELYTDNGWSNIVQQPPAPTSYTGNYIASNATNTLQVFGTNFEAGATVSVIGTDDIEVQADSVSYVSLFTYSIIISE